MNSEDEKLWKEAGELAAGAREFGVKQVKKGVSILEASDAIDEFIKEKGGQPAWPTQMSCDSVAAHFTPADGDEAAFEDELVSLDVGVQLDGFVGDTAFTVDLSGKYKRHLQAAQDALDAAIRLVRPGALTSEIGAAIADAIEKHGLHPVKNLSGHGISRFVIHDSPSIPNYNTGSKVALKEGQVIAIEPFATDGIGSITNQGESEIFAMEAKNPTRNPITKTVMTFVEKNYGPFPFAKRWLVRHFGAAKTALALRELVQNGVLTEHPPLVEKSGGMVAVFEHSILVKDKSVVLTK